MRSKRMVLCLIGIAAAMSSLAMAEEETRWHIFADAQARWEALDNYFDFDDDGGPGQDSFSFTPYRVLVGVEGELANNVSVRISMQNFGVWGGETPFLSGASTFGPAFQNLDGNLVEPSVNENDTMLYTGAITFKEMWGSRIWTTVGRQEAEFGNGLIIGNEPFYNGNVFDGIHGGWDADGWGLQAFYFKTSETGPSDTFNPNVGPLVTVDGAHDDHTLDGIYYTNRIGDGSWGDLDVYAIGFQDGFEGFGVGAPKILTLGGLWRRMVKSADEVKDHRFDWSIELAAQSGEVTDELDFDGDGETDDDLDVGGGIVEGWFGWNFLTGENLWHRLSLGVYSTSGDDDATDDSLDGWVNLFPTVHGRLGNSDFFTTLNSGSSYYIGFGPSTFAPGISALNLGYRLNIGDKHSAGTRFWDFQPTEDSIDQGLPGGDTEVDDLGNEWDIWYKYAYSENVWLYANYSMLSPDEGLTGQNAPDDSLTRFYAGIKLMVK